MVAYQFQRFRIEALIIVGSFAGFMSLSEFLEKRAQFPQFCIPMVLIPASISSNVPGTEIALGSDTALNIITQSLDQVDSKTAGECGQKEHLLTKHVRHAGKVCLVD